MLNEFRIYSIIKEDFKLGISLLNDWYKEYLKPS